MSSLVLLQTWKFFRILHIRIEVLAPAHFRPEFPVQAGARTRDRALVCRGNGADAPHGVPGQGLSAGRLNPAPSEESSPAASWKPATSLFQTSGPHPPSIDLRELIHARWVKGAAAFLATGDWRPLPTPGGSLRKALCPTNTWRGFLDRHLVGGERGGLTVGGLTV